ncbi:MAG: hypothetical protein NUW09_02700 [Deltaproteobacteria bacterium]|nr:hypothetical protein [Deltaproteobacteria bacterium]
MTKLPYIVRIDGVERFQGFLIKDGYIDFISRQCGNCWFDAPPLKCSGRVAAGHGVCDKWKWENDKEETK